MISTSDFRRGLKLIYEGQPYELVEFEHHKPGKGSAIVRTKMRNLLTGNTTDPTFRSGEKVPLADVEEKEVQFLYADADGYHFMDQASFDQYALDAKILGNATNFLLDNMTVNLVFYAGKAITINIPNHVVMEVTECAPAVKGNTATGASKSATVSTGYSCQVPLFVNQGDKIKIDTRTGQYSERA